MTDLAIVVEAGQPVVSGSGRPIAEVVHACHNRMIDEGLAELAIPGLTRDTLAPLLTYCAE